MADAKFSMADGSYPINTCADVSDAAKLAHHSKTYSFEQVKAHVMRAKNALGCGDDVLPDSWSAPRSQGDEELGYLRALPFEVVSHKDGQTLEGYAAVFDTPARIKDWAGEYDEQFSRNAFTRTLREKLPVLLFEHGLHPLFGKMPLGVFERIQPDSKGLHIRARLSDNWLIQPVRDAVRDGAITGMSVRFKTPKGGDAWVQDGASVRRTVTDATLIDLGPTVSPAYEATTASVRSILDQLPDLTGRSDARSADGGDSTDVGPGKGAMSAEQLSAMHIRDRVWRFKRNL